MITKKFIGLVLLTAVITFAVIMGAFFLLQKQQEHLSTQTIQTTTVSSTIAATGSLHSASEATLHFQTGGKLTYLPVQQGDTVYQGQTIAQLDTYALQQQLTEALNTYRSTRDTFDQTQENANTNSILQNTQRTTLNALGAGIGEYGTDINSTNYINDVVKRILDENQANLDNSVITVQLANYALQLATLTSPINGIVVSEDVTVAGQNITPATGFTIADPSQLVMRAQIAASDIDFVSVGSKAIVKIDGQQKSFQGTVTKIYPQKITLTNNTQVYNVDVQSDALLAVAKYGQNGTIVITTNTPQSVTLIPAWLLLNHTSVWVLENGKVILKTVTPGKSHGNMIEVTSGLSKNDQLLVNPQSVARKAYTLL